MLARVMAVSLAGAKYLVRSGVLQIYHPRKGEITHGVDVQDHELKRERQAQGIQENGGENQRIGAVYEGIGRC